MVEVGVVVGVVVVVEVKYDNNKKNYPPLAD